MFPIQCNTDASEKLYVDDVFSTYLYTGNGSTQTINNGIDLAGSGGLLWLKSRDSATDLNHGLFDTARGAGKRLVPNSTFGEGAGYGQTFSSTGFSVTDGTTHNQSSIKYIAWTFRKAPKFFDVVTYTGNGVAGRVIPHSLGVKPGMVIVKATSTTKDWNVWHRSLDSETSRYLVLNTTAAVAAYNMWHTAPNDANFYLSNTTDVNGVGIDYVAYLFAHDTSADGIIQCGSFSGNATINLGWEPQFVILKSTSISANWQMLDTSRSWTNISGGGGGGVQLRPNLTNAELSATAGNPIATGFTINGYSGVDGIYLAIRRPNKPPTVGTQVYNAIARTGTGAAATVTGVGFAPDMVMPKVRNQPGACTPYDRLRGALAFLQTSATNAESSAFSDTLTAFGMDGVSIGADASFGSINQNTWTYINHFFKRAPGVFDEVCYTGTGAAATQAHNLGVVPELMIVKCRTGAYDWVVYSATLGATYSLLLNTTAAAAGPSANYWNSTAPTASLFTVNAQSATNFPASTSAYAAYLFATKAGISKVGSYTGNGTTQTINCGFTTGARFILIKRTDSTGDWYVWDTVRGIIAGNDPHLSLNTLVAEVTSDDSIDPASSGFIVNQLAATNINVTSASYVFLAIA